MSDVEGYYDRKANEEWNRFDQHRTEFAVTLNALNEFLPKSPCKILDIGGGPGRYSIALAKRGYEVTLLDLSSTSLLLAKEKANEEKVVLEGYIHQNALNLNNIRDESFDAVLLMGPLYHLTEAEERSQVVFEAKRILKVDGTVFASFITLFAPFRDSARGYPEWFVENQEYAFKVLETGVHEQVAKFVRSYLAHPEEITPFMETLGFETILMIGCEGVVAGHEEEINKLEGDGWEAWVRFNYRVGKEPSMYGASDHLLYIGKKSG